MPQARDLRPPMRACPSLPILRGQASSSARPPYWRIFAILYWHFATGPRFSATLLDAMQARQPWPQVASVPMAISPPVPAGRSRRRWRAFDVSTSRHFTAAVTAFAVLACSGFSPPLVMKSGSPNKGCRFSKAGLPTRQVIFRFSGPRRFLRAF